jgi:hypothetical protein
MRAREPDAWIFKPQLMVYYITKLPREVYRRYCSHAHIRRQGQPYYVPWQFLMEGGVDKAEVQREMIEADGGLGSIGSTVLVYAVAQLPVPHCDCSQP